MYWKLFKKHKRKILEELILKDEEGISIPHFLKSINMQVASNLIAVSWNEISSNYCPIVMEKSYSNCGKRNSSPKTTESSETAPHL